MTRSSLPVTIIFVLNTLWLGAAFKVFSISPQRAAQLLARDQSDALSRALLPPLAASLRFLGGMNLALTAFALLLLFNLALFSHPSE